MDLRNEPIQFVGEYVAGKLSERRLRPIKDIALKLLVPILTIYSKLTTNHTYLITVNTPSIMLLLK